MEPITTNPANPGYRPAYRPEALAARSRTDDFEQPVQLILIPRWLIAIAALSLLMLLILGALWLSGALVL